MPKLGTKSRHKLRKIPLDVSMPEVKIPQDTSLKTCSTLECPRCDAKQGYYRVTCYRCRACFYCGLVGGSAFQCHLCGNHIPKEDRDPPAQRSMRIG